MILAYESFFLLMLLAGAAAARPTAGRAGMIRFESFRCLAGLAYEIICYSSLYSFLCEEGAV